MKKKLYIHIGTPKTGTTYLQEFFATNASVLKKFGIYYPSDAGKKYSLSNQHAPLITSLINKHIPAIPDAMNYTRGEAHDQFLEDMLKAKENDILISSEFFYDKVRLPADFKKIKKKLNQFDVKIIVYLRSQDDFYISRVQELIKSGHYVNPSVEDMIKRPYFYYSKMLDPWTQAFGKENIYVRVFDKNQWINGRLADDILSIIGVNKFSNFTDTPKNNEAISLKKALLLNEINKSLQPLSNKNSQDRWKHQSIRNVIIAMNVLNEGDMKTLLTVTERKNAMQRFNEDNKRLSEIYFDGSKLFIEEKMISNVDYKEKQHIMGDASKVIIFLIETILKIDQWKNIAMKLYKKIYLNKNGLDTEDYRVIKNSGLFDEEFYLRNYQDVNSAGIDPITHYLKHGVFELRNPSPSFNTKEYLEENREMLERGENPLVHYIRCIDHGNV